MKSPFFSVIIPTYNRENVIERCINSVLNQSFKDFEIIIVDNASSDGTINIINAIKDARITLIINEKNYERCYSRNKGISHAKGEYLCFLDSDDFYLQNHLDYLKRNIDTDDDRYEMYITNKLINNEYNNETKESEFHNYHDLSFFLKHAIIPARVCIKSNVFEYFKFESKYLIVEDTILWIEIANRFEIRLLKEPTVVYVIHENNSVNIKFNTSRKRLKGLKLFFKEQRNIAKIIGRRKINETLNRCYFGIFEHYKYKNWKFKQFIIILKSLIKFPRYSFKHKLKLLISIFISE